MSMVTKMSEVAYLAFDPGETTGWAKFDASGNCVGYGQVTQQDLAKFLDQHVVGLQAVICEEYRNYGHKQQKKWSRNQTSKNEGAIEMVCNMRSIPFHLQPANIKTIGYKWAGLGAAPTNHAASHQFDALVHGVYWLTTHKIRTPEMNIHDAAD